MISWSSSLAAELLSDPTCMVAATLCNFNGRKQCSVYRSVVPDPVNTYYQVIRNTVSKSAPELGNSNVLFVVKTVNVVSEIGKEYWTW